MEDKKQSYNSKPSSLSDKKIDDENLVFIKSVMENDTRFAETANTKKRKKQENLKTKQELKKPKKQQPVMTQQTSGLQYDDLDNMNEENLKSYSYRSRRNKFIIIVLAILLLITITVITLYVSFMKLEPNCFLMFYYNSSDANSVQVRAEYVLDGAKLSEFRTTSAITGGYRFLFSKKDPLENITDDRYLKLKIISSGEYMIEFTIDVYKDNEKLENSFAYFLSDLFIKDGSVYKSRDPIEGNQTINLCAGIVMEDLEYREVLNVNNCTIKVITQFKRA